MEIGVDSSTLQTNAFIIRQYSVGYALLGWTVYPVSLPGGRRLHFSGNHVLTGAKWKLILALPRALTRFC